MADQVETLRVLIVDDSFEDREILKRYVKGVKEYDCLVYEARDVEEALDWITDHAPDLLFVDFNMPGATGLEMLEKLRRYNRFEFPIIMLTGQGSEVVAVQALKIGVSDYLIKDDINAQSIRRSVIATIDRWRMEKTIEAQRRQLEVAARTDGLTGLWNRRYFDEQLDMELERANRYNLLLTLALGDLDKFKTVNDTYGHLIGDSVLIGFSEVVKQGLRMSDFAARYGGEEFCILMPNADIMSASFAICRLANDFRNRAFRSDKGDIFNVSVSFGLIQFDPQYDTTEKFIEAADKALYHAKENGRDKVVYHGPDGKYGTACLDNT